MEPGDDTNSTGPCAQSVAVSSVFFRVWFVYIRGMKFYPELFSEVPWYMAWSRHDGHERPLRVSAEYERRPTPLDRHYRYFRKQVRYFVL